MAITGLQAFESMDCLRIGEFNRYSVIVSKEIDTKSNPENIVKLYIPEGLCLDNCSIYVGGLDGVMRPVTWTRSHGIVSVDLGAFITDTPCLITLIAKKVESNSCIRTYDFYAESDKETSNTVTALNRCACCASSVSCCGGCY